MFCFINWWTIKFVSGLYFCTYRRETHDMCMLLYKCFLNFHHIDNFSILFFFVRSKTILIRLVMNFWKNNQEKTICQRTNKYKKNIVLNWFEKDILLKNYDNKVFLKEKIMILMFRFTIDFFLINCLWFFAYLFEYYESTKIQVSTCSVSSETCTRTDGGSC